MQHVRIGQDELIRSLNGTSGTWFRDAIRTGQGQIEIDGRRIRVAFIADSGRESEVDRALRARYGNGSGVPRLREQPSAITVVVTGQLFVTGSFGGLDRGQATVHGNGGPVHVRAAGSGEEGDHLTDVFRLGHAAQRDQGDVPVEPFDGDEGELPAETDSALLAKYVMTIGNGVAVQSAGGTERADLQLIVDATLQNWPPVLSRVRDER